MRGSNFGDVDMKTVDRIQVGIARDEAGDAATGAFDNAALGHAQEADIQFIEIVFADAPLAAQPFLVRLDHTFEHGILEA